MFLFVYYYHKSDLMFFSNVLIVFLLTCGLDVIVFILLFRILLNFTAFFCLIVYVLINILMYWVFIIVILIIFFQNNFMVYLNLLKKVDLELILIVLRFIIHICFLSMMVN